MSKRHRKLLLEDILESGNKIYNYVYGYDFDTFVIDERTRDAVVRNFEIIGEASNRIDVDFKNQHSDIPWARLRGLRNRIIHEYFGIDFELVWHIIQNDLNPLLKKVETLYENIETQS
ncbi:MAG: DUF86 domain-containing protein [Candidatus Kapabacteria bacterium]|nr:DUF86 domain-containing protein [Ignavibacteriota bacterium]MCW5884808.1 DUF86 domain-containing protein [Candidatus Kapabacteria bacterium]